MGVRRRKRSFINRTEKRSEQWNSQSSARNNDLSKGLTDLLLDILSGIYRAIFTFQTVITLFSLSKYPTISLFLWKTGDCITIYDWNSTSVPLLSSESSLPPRMISPVWIYGDTYSNGNISPQTVI
ncbi:hypothetical protein CEXT_362931 [Caerostris extrusa]|uniref:Uncharacterized protein n=1 Tax=Caerostris extrusa TaxID=172846 RepID=A0AAV4XMM8_CAEEX|nr:hypothetical protein CEXT_362931 [Caerostris extrusa]